MRYRRAHFGGATVDSIADDRSGEGILRVSCFFELISFGALKGIFFDVWAGFFAKQRVAAAAARTWLGTNKQAFRCNHLFIRHFHSFPRSKAKAKKKKKKSSRQASCIEIRERGYISSTSCVGFACFHQVCAVHTCFVTGAKARHEQARRGTAQKRYPVAQQTGETCT